MNSTNAAAMSTQAVSPVFRSMASPSVARTLPAEPRRARAGPGDRRSRFGKMSGPWERLTSVPWRSSVPSAGTTTTTSRVTRSRRRCGPMRPRCGAASRQFPTRRCGGASARGVVAARVRVPRARRVGGATRARAARAGGGRTRVRADAARRTRRRTALQRAGSGRGDRPDRHRRRRARRARSRTLDAAGWERTGVYNYPTPQLRTVEWIGRHTVHELRHHTVDVERLL